MAPRAKMNQQRSRCVMLWCCDAKWPRGGGFWVPVPFNPWCQAISQSPRDWSGRIGCRGRGLCLDASVFFFFFLWKRHGGMMKWTKNQTSEKSLGSKCHHSWVWISENFSQKNCSLLSLFLTCQRFLVSFCDEWIQDPFYATLVRPASYLGWSTGATGSTGKSTEATGDDALPRVTRRTTQTFVESPSSSLVIEIQVRVEVLILQCSCVDWFGRDWWRHVLLVFWVGEVRESTRSWMWSETILNTRTACAVMMQLLGWQKRFDWWLCSPSCQCALLVMGKFFQASAVFQRLSFVWMWGFGIFGSGLQIRTRVSLAHKAQLREEASPRFGGTGANQVQLTNINPNWGFPMSLDPDLGDGWKLICFDCNLQNSTFICN